MTPYTDHQKKSAKVQASSLVAGIDARIKNFWRVVLMRVPGWRLNFFSEIGDDEVVNGLVSWLDSGYWI
ncbi:MAG TPA: hypothetical protein VLN58_12535 [Verrucomicrobiae bacterium]|nr:hypothetical protein [Verrucomicrobiae bacterium]